MVLNGDDDVPNIENQNQQNFSLEFDGWMII